MHEAQWYNNWVGWSGVGRSGVWWVGDDSGVGSILMLRKETEQKFKKEIRVRVGKKIRGN